MKRLGRHLGKFESNADNRCSKLSADARNSRTAGALLIGHETHQPDFPQSAGSGVTARKIESTTNYRIAGAIIAIERS
jgi:hypothetical protein